MGVTARRFTGNPAGFAGGCRQLSIQRDACLQRDERASRTNPMAIDLVETPCLFFATADVDTEAQLS